MARNSNGLKSQDDRKLLPFVSFVSSQVSPSNGCVSSSDANLFSRGSIPHKRTGSKKKARMYKKVLEVVVVEMMAWSKKHTFLR